MKNLSYILALALLVGFMPSDAAAQKVKKKDQIFAKPFSSKKFWNAETWVFTKMAIHYKVISTELASGGDKNQDVDARSWAMLDGVSDETMARITENFSIKFKNRIKAEFGINVEYWDHIKSSKNAMKIQEKVDPKEHVHKGSGAMVTYTANDGPWYKRFGGFIPDGKKLAKEFDGAACELDICVDFAAFETTISTNKDWDWQGTTTTTNVQQGIVPVVFITPSVQQSMAQPRAATTLTGMDAVGYLMLFSVQKTVESSVDYVTSIEPHKGDMPSIMKRKFNLVKPEMTATFVVNADEAKYEKAVNEALDIYLDALIEAIRAEKG